MIQYIKSRDNALVKYVKKLRLNSVSKDEQKFVIEGEHLCLMAKDNLEYVLTNQELDQTMFPNQYVVTKEILEKLSEGKSSARIIGVCKTIKQKNIDSRLVLYLDDVQDPGNVGTLFRTALSFGFNTVYVTNKTAYQYNSKVIQSSQGAIFNLDVRNTDTNTISELKKNGYKIIATALHEKSIYAHDYQFKNNEKYVIILGNEGQGVSREILNSSDECLKINIVGMESLNVAIAGAIVMNEAFNEGE